VTGVGGGGSALKTGPPSGVAEKVGPLVVLTGTAGPTGSGAGALPLTVRVGTLAVLKGCGDAEVVKPGDDGAGGGAPKPGGGAAGVGAKRGALAGGGPKVGPPGTPPGTTPGGGPIGTLPGGGAKYGAGAGSGAVVGIG
jgi:hypothetical protein